MQILLLDNPRNYCSLSHLSTAGSEHSDIAAVEVGVSLEKSCWVKQSFFC